MRFLMLFFFVNFACFAKLELFLEAVMESLAVTWYLLCGTIHPYISDQDLASPRLECFLWTSSVARSVW